jgi:pimeloyl-ACP methyl ester carboxylesterase
MKTKKNTLIAILVMAITLPSCSKKDFEISQNANNLFHVKNGSYLIPVQVRGNTAGKKIILYIQGGPGINALDFAAVDYPGWKKTLEKDYAVAYYDQRGMGNMQGNFSQGQNVLSTWVEDLHQVAAFLKKAYNADITMLGHSFGGSLMYRYMISKGNSGIPVKYISASAPVTTDADTDTLRWTFRREFLYNTANLETVRGKNISRWNEVLQWLSVTPVIKKLPGNDPYKLMIQWNKYVEELVSSEYPEKSPEIKDYLKAVFSSSYNPLPAYLTGKYREDLIDRIISEEEQDVLMPKLQQISNQNLLILTGRYDDICPPEELNYIYGKITSGLKKMSIIDYAGHEPFTNQPAAFFNEIKLFIQ